MPHHVVRAARILAAGAAVLACHVGAIALEVSESVDLPVPPSRAWSFVGDFGSLAWHPVVAETKVIAGRNNARGAVRAITTRDGARLLEELEGYSAGQRRLSYRIIESPLPVANYMATLSVAPHAGGSRIVWSSRFERDQSALGVDDAKARTIVTGIYRAGLDALLARVAAEASK